MRKTKNDLAERIYKLSQRIKADKDELEELRGALEAKMKPGQAVVFGTPEGIYRLKLVDCSETILKTNEEIKNVVGSEIFEQAAKFGVKALKDAINANAPEGHLREILEARLRGKKWEEHTYESCVKAVLPKPTLKLLKGKE